MYVESPHLPERTPATRATLEALIPGLIGAKDPFAIIDNGDQMIYAQVLWMPSGFSLDYQEGSLDRHYRTVRDDLAPDEVIAALCGYIDRSPSWRLGLEFKAVELRSPSYRAGRAVGRVVGRIWRWLR